MISLLSSESDVIRQYCCETLANALCWETRLILNFERFSYHHCANLQLMNSSCDQSFLANIPLSHKPLRDQIQLCDGRRQLSSLLTSPTARVNLAQSRCRGHDINEKVSSVHCRNRFTSSVQGLASKAACRALVNLFCTSDCIPSPQRSENVLGHPAASIMTAVEANANLGESDVNFISSTASSRKTVANACFSKSKSTVVKPMKGNGRQIEPSFESPFKIPCVPWKFVYFHKSGFEKDTHTVWLQIDPNKKEIRGRGIDSVGLFFLRGHANYDMEGHSWQVDKCYLQKPIYPKCFSEEKQTDQEKPVEKETLLQEWIKNASGVWIDNDEISEWGRPHICHTIYESSSVEEVPISSDFVVNQKNSALRNLRCFACKSDGKFREDWAYYNAREPLRMVLSAQDSLRVQRKKEYDEYVRFNTNWGRGLYGVWEVSTIESHYDLLKGGVFQASPMN